MCGVLAGLLNISSRNSRDFESRSVDSFSAWFRRWKAHHFDARSPHHRLLRRFFLRQNRVLATKARAFVSALHFACLPLVHAIWADCLCKRLVLSMRAVEVGVSNSRQVR